MSKKVQESMSQAMLDNIKNYSNEIVTLEDFVTAVRQNPGYHLGSIGNAGHINMIREIEQNSFDEADKDSSPCDTIWIRYDDRTQEFTCIDNGRGIPFDNILRVFTNPNTSSNYIKKKGEYSSGLHGVGAKVTNAMSHKFIIESYILGEGRRVEFTEGYPWDKGEQIIKKPSLYQGSKVSFTPSIKALGAVTNTWKDILNLTMLILPLCKIGTTVHFTGIDLNGKEYNDTIVNNDGIMTYLINATHTPMIKPIYISKDTGEMKTDIIFTWDAANMSTTNITAFANKCPTRFGYHIDGFEKGVTTFFCNYMNKTYLAGSKKKITIIPADIKIGLNAVVTVSLLKPIFDGQSKEKLSNIEIEGFVKSTIISQLNDWIKNNPKDILKLCKFFKEIAEVRISADKQKIKLTDKYAKSKLSGLPSKFVAPTGKTDLEFFITEGDSAAGLIKNHRENKTQGYFPIRGKLPNAFNTSKEKFLSNAEVAGIIQIIGGGYGKNFNIDKVKWKKIIFMPDADADGDHISSLLLRFFILYMPELITSGRVYKAMAPLYGIAIGKNNVRYLHDRMEYIEYIQKQFSKNNIVEDAKTKRKIAPKELSKILYQNIDYLYELNKIAKRYAVDPILLESIIMLTLNKKSLQVMSKSLKKQFRFLSTIEKKGDTIIIEGLVNSKYQTVFVNDKFMQDCMNIIEILKANESFVYIINNKPCSIYEMMSLFDKSAPVGIQRYKGLGEMNGEKLFDSTLNPNNRVLIQYTIEDVEKEIETIKYYEANKNLLLTDTKLTRFDVIE